MTRLLYTAVAAALITFPALAADLPQTKDPVLAFAEASVQPETPYCHSLWPAWFIVQWQCDPYGLPHGTDDRSVTHAPITSRAPPAPPSTPPGNTGGCDEGKGDRNGRR